MGGRLTSVALLSLLLTITLGHALVAADPTGADAGAPRGIHLSILGDARTSMTVTWFTDTLLDPNPLVEYGPTPALGFTVAATSQELPGVEALGHEATMTGLAPGAVTYYRVGGDSGWSDVLQFRTDDGDGKFRLAIIGDHGHSTISQSTINHLVAAAPDLLVIAGDLSYANGDQPDWDVWFTMMEPLASRIPLMPAIGNHEYETGWGTQAFRTRLALPGAELFYGFDYGRIHFIMFDSDTNALRAEGLWEENLAFFLEDVQEAGERRLAGEIDHIVVVQHHPPYSNHPDAGRALDPDVAAVQEPQLQKSGVKLLVAGHNHNYERSKPMAFTVPTTVGPGSDHVDPAGYQMIITGGGGAALYPFKDPNDFALWSAAYAERYHYTFIDVNGGKLTGKAVDTWFAPGTTFDRWSLTFSPTPLG